MTLAQTARVGHIKDFRELDVWQRAVDLSVEAYRLSKRFPSEENFGLGSQLRRAGVSVCANIAEGYGRDSRAEYVRFLRIARGSTSEVIALLILAERVGCASPGDVRVAHSLSDRIRAMLTRLIAAVRQVPGPTAP